MTAALGSKAPPVDRCLDVAIVSGVCVQRDAISASVRDDVLAFSERFGFRTKVFTYKNEYPEIDAVEVADLTQICFDPFFLNCDLILYHFGIYYELFNTIFLGNGTAPQVVRFHNLTPRHLLPPSEWPVAERSATQMFNLRAADAVWAVSEINRQDVLAAELIPEQAIDLMPLSVGDGQRRAGMAGKEGGPIQLLFVGRIVKAKGLLDLLRAVATFKQEEIPFSLRIVGDMRFSHTDFVQALEKSIAVLRLADCVTLVGGVSDEELEQEYARAHILVLPSYHEGFCKPVIEAMRFGCVPVTYDSSNLKYVADGYSRTVPAGDVTALALGISEVARSLNSVLQGHSNGPITVDRGGLSLADYESGVDLVLAGYGLPAVSEQLRQAARKLVEGPGSSPLRLDTWVQSLGATR
jgi:glycosyltransferase involved in cell wall biosynthesis